MRAIVFGATGATGRLIIDELSKLPISVIAVERPEGKTLGTEHPNLKIVRGSPTDDKFVKSLVKKGDIVVSALGPSRASRNPWARVVSPLDLMQKSVEAILKACDENGASKFIYMSAYGVGVDWTKLPWWMRFMVRVSNVIYAYEDHGQAEALVPRYKTPVVILKPVILVDGDRNVNPHVAGKERLSSFAMINRRAVATHIAKILTEPATRHVVQELYGT